MEICDHRHDDEKDGDDEMDFILIDDSGGAVVLVACRKSQVVFCLCVRVFCET
jgi:hypothetical protein